MYDRLNQVNVCVSYPATLSLMDEVSTMHTIPLKQWIADGDVFKFWGDNVDKKRKVRDVRSDHQGEMVHMFSLLVGKSRTPAPWLTHSGQLSKIPRLSSSMFLPTCDDVDKVKSNLLILVSRVFTQYISGLAPLSKSIPKHIEHRYTTEMSRKSDVNTIISDNTALNTSTSKASHLIHHQCSQRAYYQRSTTLLRVHKALFEVPDERQSLVTDALTVACW